jgi:hypothetical protein
MTPAGLRFKKTERTIRGWLDGSALSGVIERNQNMETFCGWIDCYASYAGNYMPPGWANLLAGRC